MDVPIQSVRSVGEAHSVNHTSSASSLVLKWSLSSLSFLLVLFLLLFDIMDKFSANEPGFFSDLRTAEISWRDFFGKSIL